jgi:YHS domain-containing protein
LFVPKGTLGEEQRRHLSGRIINELIRIEDHAPASVIEASLAISQVVVHEPDQWIVGGRPFDPAEPPRYVVRVSVPGAWRREMSEHLISVITRVLAEADEDPQRLYQEPHAWVYVVGIPEGGSGAFGKVMHSNDILKMITSSFRESRHETLPAQELAPGTRIDPICGMTVSLTESAITLEHDGTTYAFCSHGCRALFAEEVRGATAA